ncbi:MAG: T9SS type A sorting domain-containing protein [Bacteroidales bacterium]|jgi:hypothetical protein|nr:T9SS type A sorting domain-containing protein [Bacteroidales bacterium]
MHSICKFVFFFSVSLLVIAGQQTKAQGLSSEDVDRYERLESLLKLMPDEFHALLPGINEEAINRLQVQKSRDTEVYHLIDTALVFTTIPTQNTKRYTYTYDEAGKLTIKLLKEDQNDQWQNVSFESLNYDDFDNVELSTTKVWEGGAWVNNQRVNSQYIQNNLLELRIVETWEGTWEFQTRDSFNWYPGGTMASHLEEIWDSQEWINQYYSIFIRDENEKLLELTVQNWDGSNWQNIGKTLNTYNSSGLNDSSFVMIWTEDNWEYFYLQTNSYENNLISSQTGAFYENNTWVSDVKSSYTHNTNGLIDVATMQKWIDNAWQNIERNNFYYNEWGSFETILGENWQIDSWVNTTLKSFIFDEAGNALEGILYTWENDSWQNTRDDAFVMPYNYGIYSEAFTGYLVEIAYRSILVGTKENPAKLNLRVYPNPVSTVLNIEIPFTIEGGILVLTMIDQQGKQVLQKTLVNHSKNKETLTLDLTDYKNGLYTLTFSGENINASKKILIKNR